jgi:DNA mismatch endonuclease (patch repair protein)
MTDRFTKQQRSEIMARIKGRNTTPERTVRSMLHKMGYRFRLHVRELPGRPDIVLPRHGKIILVHGCFWHGHNCGRGTRPGTNPEFWNRKIDGNMERDKRTRKGLHSLSWKVLVLWECQIKNGETLHRRLRKFMS